MSKRTFDDRLLAEAYTNHKSKDMIIEQIINVVQNNPRLLEEYDWREMLGGAWKGFKDEPADKGWKERIAPAFRGMFSTPSGQELGLDIAQSGIDSGRANLNKSRGLPPTPPKTSTDPVTSASTDLAPVGPSGSTPEPKQGFNWGRMGNVIGNVNDVLQGMRGRDGKVRMPPMPGLDGGGPNASSERLPPLQAGDPGINPANDTPEIRAKKDMVKGNQAPYSMGDNEMGGPSSSQFSPSGGPVTMLKSLLKQLDIDKLQSILPQIKQLANSLSEQ